MTNVDSEMCFDIDYYSADSVHHRVVHMMGIIVVGVVLLDALRQYCRSAVKRVSEILAVAAVVFRKLENFDHVAIMWACEYYYWPL